MKPILFSTLSALALLPAANAAIVAGQTIGIDFGSTAPTAALNFNDFGNPTIADGATLAFGSTLIDTSGANVTGVGFEVANNTGQETNSAVTTAGVGGPIGDITVWGDIFISNNASGRNLDAVGVANITLTFTDLEDSLTYNLVGGWDSNNNNFQANWAADGQSQNTNPQGTDGYISFTGLQTDGSGNLVITITRTNNHVSVGGITLTAVPEPSAALLGVLGAFTLLRRRR